MRKVMLLVLSVVSALGLSLVSIAPAQALGGESLACHFTDPTWSSPCQATVPAGSYTVIFKVLNTSGSYTFSWTPPSTPSAGCGSTNDFCTVTFPAVFGDVNHHASVTITQAGQSTPLSVDAFIPATCRLGQLWTWC